MRIVIAAITIASLAGCQAPVRMTGLDDLGGQIEYGNKSYGLESIEGVKFVYAPQDKSGDALPVCVAQTVENNSVTLEGTMTVGRYYSWSNERETGGGQVISYVSDDRKTVIANGTVTLGSKGLLTNSEQFIRYTLSMKSTPNGLIASFGKVQRALASTGSMKNQGFEPIGTWKQMHPDQAIKTLKSVSDKIDACLAEL